MTPLERLRLATALVHAVPGAVLELRTDQHERIVVGNHPSADIDPCKMRRIVAAMACPNRPDLAGRVSEVSFGGELVDMGGGVFATRTGGREHRWLASLLGFPTLAELLDDAGPDTLPSDVMHATLKPDPELGVTVVGVTVEDDRFADRIDDVAADVAAACFVAELCGVTSEDALGHHRSEGVS